MRSIQHANVREMVHNLQHIEISGKINDLGFTIPSSCLFHQFYSSDAKEEILFGVRMVKVRLCHVGKL